MGHVQLLPGWRSCVCLLTIGSYIHSSVFLFVGIRTTCDWEPPALQRKWHRLDWRPLSLWWILLTAPYLATANWRFTCRRSVTRWDVRSGKDKSERNWKSRMFLAALGRRPGGASSPVSPQEASADGAALHSRSVPRMKAEARPWVRRGAGRHYSWPVAAPRAPRREAANARRRPSCNHRWHTWSSFPDRFSCPSSCEWGKQHRKNNTSCSRA